MMRRRRQRQRGEKAGGWCGDDDGGTSSFLFSAVAARQPHNNASSAAARWELVLPITNTWFGSRGEAEEKLLITCCPTAAGAAAAKDRRFCRYSSSAEAAALRRPLLSAPLGLTTCSGSPATASRSCCWLFLLVASLWVWRGTFVTTVTLFVQQQSKRVCNSAGRRH